MTKKTKLELLKIAATLTVASSSNKTSKDIKSDFEQHCFYLFENFDRLGTTKKVSDESCNEHSVLHDK
jgi:hypothetical protein